MPLQNHNGKVPGAMFFAAYAGSSMNPTLREPEVMEILPYGRRPLRVGDVAFFLPPAAGQPVVHRVVRVTAAGISTRGDNHAREDAFLVPPAGIQGQVVAVWRGRRRRVIAGGLRGRLTRRWLPWQRLLDRGVSPLLRPLYRALSGWGVIAWMLPVSWRPRVAVFHVQGRDQFQLLLGPRLIGRYDDQRQQWQIQRPFQLLADGRRLPRPQWHALVLADGSRWEIAAGDAAAAAVVSQLGGAMQLRPATGAGEPSPRGPRRRLLVQVEAQASMAGCYVPVASKNDGVFVVRMLKCFCDNASGAYVNLVRLSLVFARAAQARGGVLIHGALAERDGQGVILAAASGTGKTTASNRLPAPWRSLCDDTTLVVRDPQGGRYWAHPWPTWSRFLDGGPGGAWDVQTAVPLKGIFFLARAVEERVERVGAGHAVSLLVECAGQASTLMAADLDKEERRALCLEQFNNLCAVAQAVPAHRLHLGLTGAFWQKLDQALDDAVP